MSTIPILATDPNDFVVFSDPAYVEVGVTDFLGKISFTVPTLLQGQKGCGKTEGVRQMCASRGFLRVSFSCTEETRVSDLLGSFILIGNNVHYQYGALAQAMALSEYGPTVLVLEEVNALTPQVQKTLNPLTDGERGLYIPKLQRVIKGNPDHLWVVATQNPGYAGTYSLNPDLKSRFQVIPVPYMTEAQEVAVLRRHAADAGVTEDRIITGLVRLARDTRGVRDGKSLGYALSTRDITYAVRLAAKLPLPSVILTLAHKMEDPEEFRDFAARAKSVFSEVNLTQEKTLW